MLMQTPIPQEYLDADTADLAQRIAQRKDEFGSRLCILGHHYQRDEVIRFADFTGDSLKLSQVAAEQDAEFIVFCGVHFMAESADILTSDKQRVSLPHMLAGCAMAEMADDDAVATALRELQAMTDEKIVPISYVNSTAAIKSITGTGGGACCTSSNVRNVFNWALSSEKDNGAGADKIFAVPDQHLARNTAIAMGYREYDTVVYDPSQPDGGLSRDDVQRARFILWKGHCYVHQKFKAEHVHKVRKKHPGIRVIVHPECPHEVVKLADAAGSTQQIIRAIEESEPDTQWAIGTESNLVNRLAKKHSDKFIRVLSDAPSLCMQMGRIDLPHLLWVLDNLADGNVVNRVSVESDVAKNARLALQRMIDIKGVKNVTPNE